MPDAAAAALSVTPHTVGFHIVRHYFDAAGEVFEVTITVYPPSRLEYSFDLELSGSAPRRLPA